MSHRSGNELRNCLMRVNQKGNEFIMNREYSTVIVLSSNRILYDTKKIVDFYITIKYNKN